MCICVGNPGLDGGPGLPGEDGPPGNDGKSVIRGILSQHMLMMCSLLCLSYHAATLPKHVCVFVSEAVSACSYTDVL